MTGAELQQEPLDVDDQRPFQVTLGGVAFEGENSKFVGSLTICCISSESSAGTLRVASGTDPP